MRTFIVFLLCLTLFPIKALAAPKVETNDRPTAAPYRVVNLGTLGGVLPGRSDSVARAINHLGQIVGSSEGGGFVRHPFIYDNGRMVARMVDLNSLIPADSGWELEDATGINDSGEICGFGWWRRTESRAFVLKLSGTAP